ncbi:MAG: hypothetical protein Kow0062_07840 [Acidobacteriota bacterium]
MLSLLGLGVFSGRRSTADAAPARDGRCGEGGGNDDDGVPPPPPGRFRTGGGAEVARLAA